MVTAFDDYTAAYNAARLDALWLNRPIGIERCREYARDIFRTHLLPIDPARRFGWELRVEVVEPGSPRTQTVGRHH